MNQPDFGMPTLIELPDIEECISLCKDLKLQFIEINMNMPQYQTDRLAAKIHVIKKMREQGVYFTFHLDENFNPSDFNKKISQAYIETLHTTIEIAKTLHAPVINMHMAEGVHFKLPDRRVYLF